ncbi:MAG: hypothetical protein GYB64_03200 [Chloroflexi bacterium]|nr:hypothetical protein [Chloroflexota bacterium]
MPPVNQDAIKHASSVKAAHEQTLLTHPNVVGVGVGFRRKGGRYTDEVVIVVRVRDKQALNEIPPEDVLPAELDGVPVDIQETGDVSSI